MITYRPLWKKSKGAGALGWEKTVMDKLYHKTLIWQDGGGKSNGFAPFLSFFVFCAAFLFGSFWGVSPIAMGGQGAALDLQAFEKA